MTYHLSLHEILQSYLEDLYLPYTQEIKQSLLFYQNEHYGELYYYSFQTLIRHLELSKLDHFLDIGSGLGKIVLQTFLSTDVAAVSGIEINLLRYQIASKVVETIRQTLPNLFTPSRTLELLHGDFLHYTWQHITVIYVCSTVFSSTLLENLGKKISTLPHVRCVASLRKLPHLHHFVLSKKIFLHADWERVPCYIYTRTR